MFASTPSSGGGGGNGSSPPPVRFLEPVGRTLRLAPTDDRGGGEDAPRVVGVLVVGVGLPCHYWLSILPLARDPALCYFIRERDLRTVADRLHLRRPAASPAFLVAVDGYFVDAFPAPVPPAEHPVEPTVLLGMVRERLAAYAPR